MSGLVKSLIAKMSLQASGNHSHLILMLPQPLYALKCNESEINSSMKVEEDR